MVQFTFFRKSSLLLVWPSSTLYSDLRRCSSFLCSCAIWALHNYTLVQCTQQSISARMKREQYSNAFLHKNDTRRPCSAYILTATYRDMLSVFMHWLLQTLLEALDLHINNNVIHTATCVCLLWIPLHGKCPSTYMFILWVTAAVTTLVHVYKCTIQYVYCIGYMNHRQECHCS